MVDMYHRVDIYLLVTGFVWLICIVGLSSSIFTTDNLSPASQAVNNEVRTTSVSVGTSSTTYTSTQAHTTGGKQTHDCQTCDHITSNGLQT